jgi:membrane-bound serine protease (ClpP class)
MPNLRLPRPARVFQLYALRTLMLCIVLCAGDSWLGSTQGILAQLADSIPSLAAQDSVSGRSANEVPPGSWPANPLVYRFELVADIMPPAWRTVQRAVSEAHAVDADVLLVQLDTYGGMVNIADSISQRLLHAKMPVLVFIANNAASAGALISLSCDSIYMAPSSQIGAATVVNGVDGAAAPDKYQAYMRAKMRSIAEAQGRNPDIAEAMVDQDLAVEGVVEAGKTLVFTPSEAIANGFCEGIAEDWKGALEQAGVRDYEVMVFEPSAVDRIVQFLVNPAVSGILMLVIFFGIYAELQTPGVGFPIAAAAIAAALYFAPHYLDGLAASWEIALFVLGILLLAVEVFVLPGFGVAGVAGLALILSSLVLSLLANQAFDFEWVPGDTIVRAILTVLVAVFGAGGLIVVFLGSLTDSPLLKRLVLQEAQNADAGYRVSASGEDAAESDREWIGKGATALSDLRPSGRIQLDGDEVGIPRDAMTEGGYTPAGARVTVVGVRGTQLLVRERQTPA